MSKEQLVYIVIGLAPCSCTNETARSWIRQPWPRPRCGGAIGGGEDHGLLGRHQVGTVRGGAVGAG